MTQIKKRYQAIRDSIKNLYNKNRITLVIILCLMCVGASYKLYIKSRESYTRWQVKVVESQAEKARQELSQMEEARKAIERAENLKKQQVVSASLNDIVIVYNAAERSEITKYKDSIINWAKSNQFDAVVFGRIQPSFDGKVNYTTFDGKNQVPLNYVINVLEENGCENAISFMGNRTKFWLPSPFVKQIDGDLKFYTSAGVTVAGFSLSASKLKVRSDNFFGSITEGTLNGSFDKPWDQK